MSLDKEAMMISSSPSPSPINNDNNYNNEIQSGMEKTATLILGYIRGERLSFSDKLCNCKCRSDMICGIHNIFPLAIISMITLFYPKMNGKLFCWHIDNPNIIKNFINAKHKQRFASDIFEMKNLKWYLSAYPNGDRKEGSCTVYLTLISFPTNWSKFICNYSIYCNQTRSSATYITTYTEKRSQSGRIAGLLSIQEIKQKYNTKQLNAITFSVNVCILQIFDNSLSHKLIYQYNLYQRSFNSKYIIIWNVDKYMVDQFIKSDAIKQYETDVFYDMFCLAFCPNGGWKENQGQARLSLKLCCLPNKISKIKVKMELLCLETETYYSDICDFGYDSKNTVRAWPSDILLSQQLNGLNKLTFKCMVFIIAKYDQKGNEIIIDNIDNGHGHPIIDHNDIIYDHDIKQDIDDIETDDNNNNNINKIQSQISNITTMLDSLNEKIENMKFRLDQTGDNNNNNNDMINESQLLSEEIKEEDKQKQVLYFLNDILGMNEYYQLFIENGLDDMDIITKLTMDELEQLPIKKIGHRKKIKQEIDKLNNLSIKQIFWNLYPPKTKQ